MKITSTYIVSLIVALAFQANAQVATVKPAPAPKAENSFGLPGQKSSKATAVYRASRSSVPPVVVQFSSADSSRVQEMSEDLDVMTHIVDTALRDGDVDEETPEKMGVKMYITGSSRSVRSMYVEDFGALFMVKVNFPLQGAPVAKEKEPEKPTDSEWARARAEVFGPAEPGWPDMFGSGTAVDFDPKRVDGLKSTLVRALKNASNIRHLKPQEFVSLSVFGSAGRIEVRSNRSGDEPRTSSNSKRPARISSSSYGGLNVTTEAVVVNYSGSTGQGTVLTLRVKKSDIDAFAKGEMDEAAFTKTVTFNNYAGAGNDITSVNSWVNDSIRAR